MLNALKEVHLILSQGAHNQFGDLPVTARVEMLMQQWILARPEFADFLPTRAMVAYPEPWMDRVDAMKRVQGWSDVNVLHFRDLGVFGEKLLLTIRYGSWVDVTIRIRPRTGCGAWRPEIQGYIHAYRAVTGADVTTEVNATLPSALLQQRLAQQPRARVYLDRSCEGVMRLEEARFVVQPEVSRGGNFQWDAPGAGEWEHEGAGVQPAGPFGRLVLRIDGGIRYQYPLTADDVLWLARFIKGEAGGRVPHRQPRRGVGDVQQVPALDADKRWRTFAAFLRAYSTTLQPHLVNPAAVERAIQIQPRKPQEVQVGSSGAPFLTAVTCAITRASRFPKGNCSITSISSGCDGMNCRRLCDCSPNGLRRERFRTRLGSRASSRTR